ncbi:GntR family transcriptional regulator [Alicyclobacillus fastidiosus]|uniref:GntR family transcriptional regulator n=1 Tax=Alicyclobacillus fastidiosus TaxID=392011 RepID=A0ABV5AGK2_9BACL|nr:GntR family transcriptional regulator [Alicyclobacillus fastidiosus]WEH09494.1 GntR family transcriptional regulator [Alicyclobacillus fastidiosus]
MSERSHTKTDIAVREIRTRILTGVYQSGTRLRQNELVKNLGLGVTPVREALMQLISEGLLVRKPYAGVVVSHVTSTSVAEMYAVRKVLEKFATETACAHLSEGDMDRLSNLMNDMKKAHEANDDRLYQTANHAFHMTIYAASQNQRLTELIESQWRTFPRGVFGFSRERRESSSQEHGLIFDALRKRDHLTAGALMVAHITNYESHVQELLGHQQK